MDRHRKPKQLAQYAKNPGKTFGFSAERTGREQPVNPLGKSKFKNEAAQNPTRAASLSFDFPKTTVYTLVSHFW
jgi:hypothetical protein